MIRLRRNFVAAAALLAILLPFQAAAEGAQATAAAPGVMRVAFQPMVQTDPALISSDSEEGAGILAEDEVCISSTNRKRVLSHNFSHRPTLIT